MPEQMFVNCTTGGPVFVHVKDGRVIRVRPLILDDSDAPSWTIEAGGRKFTPPRKATLSPYTMTDRVRLYSEDRIKYPLKRVDFDVKGNRHTENRGKSGYERISWNEALDTIATEMKAVREKYGAASIMSRCSSHHIWGLLGYRTSVWARFFNMIGFTDIFDNPDSWEGWHWGATHAFGFYWKLGLPEQNDLLYDALNNSELVVHWSNDPDSIRGGYGSQESAIWRLWLREQGKKQIFIDPFCNYTAVVLGDKWIAPRPGTDSALAMAIAYVWIKENTYDKEYVKKRTLGFEDFKKHILGEDDGVPKTPGWAENICGVPGRVITALAREWGSKRTMLGAGHGGEGGACRQAYGTEWARMMVLLPAMQGLGKPGVNVWGATAGAPPPIPFDFPGYSDGGINKFAQYKPVNPVKQRLYRPIVPESVMTPPIHWLGEGFCAKSLEQQFIPYVYPMPGYPECRMFYRYGGSFIGTMTDSSKWIRMYQSSKLQFVVNQGVWMDPETRMADIILPACTNFERSDISRWCHPAGYGWDGTTKVNHAVIVYQKKCIEPLYESKSDYQIFVELAERLGLKEQYTEGHTEEDWVKIAFENSDLPKFISWEDFQKKGYFVIPNPATHKPTPGMRWYYEGKECDTPDKYSPLKGTARGEELGTNSGKIEFVAQSLLKHFPNDEERPPLPRYIPSWEGHTSELTQKYPLQLISPHPRYSYHTHYDTHAVWMTEIPGQRVIKDGYPWQTVRIHPTDAAARAIRHGDIIKMYNDRGTVLGIATLTERIKPGVIHSYTSSSNYDPLEKGNPASIDKGGCVNLLTPSRLLSKNAPGMAPNSCLIEVARWEM
jgi:anaerobic selenocysteine-containing dehydrogenase